MEMGLKSPRPTGAFYLYPSFKKWASKLGEMGITTCGDLSTYLLDYYHIATLPGSAFGDDPKNLCLRLSSSFLDMETDEQAQEILDAYREENDPKIFMEIHHPRTSIFLEKMRKFIAELNG
jgi:aspartate/methionine/tyrosine aminotransferase